MPYRDPKKRAEAKRRWAEKNPAINRLRNRVYARRSIDKARKKRRDSL